MCLLSNRNSCEDSNESLAGCFRNAGQRSVIPTFDPKGDSAVLGSKEACKVLLEVVLSQSSDNFVAKQKHVDLGRTQGDREQTKEGGQAAAWDRREQGE